MAHRVGFFDLWQAGYAGASVAVYVAGTDTLASLYTNEALTVTAANPQTLLSLSASGVNYGKFAVPLYTNSAYELVVNSTDETGIIRPPLTTLSGEDASKATVKVAGASVARELEDYGAIKLEVENSGVFLPTTDANASASTNNATLVAAIGAAAALGGGYVEIPAGTFAITTLTVSPSVILRGRGEGVTILQSVQGSAVLTLGGDNAGLEDITIDGVSNQVNSIGVYSKANDQTRMRRSMVKRFATGVHYRGGLRSTFQDLSIDGCNIGAKLHGDNDASGGANGDVFQRNRWEGGRVSNCTVYGVEFAYVDKKCWHNTIDGVGFESNTGIALRVNGARWTEIGKGCWFASNATNLAILDGTDATKATENTVVGFHVDGGVIDSGAMTFTGKCQDVVFDRVEFNGGTYTLTTVTNQILTRDCTEASGVVLAGNDSSKWVRSRRILSDYPNSAGVTTDNVATEAWAYNLAPGEVVHAEAVVIGNGRNTTDRAVYHIARSAGRPGSTLLYDAQTANFTLGATLTGGTSGATARIIADADGGATGTLTVRDIVGEFVDNETITDSSGGSALANGVLAHQNAALLAGLTSLETAYEDDAGWACIFAVSADELQVHVTGNTGDTIEWCVSVKVTSG